MITISNPEKYVVGILVRLSNERIEDLKKLFNLKVNAKMKLSKFAFTYENF